MTTNHEQLAESNRFSMRHQFMMGKKPTIYFRASCSYCPQPSLSELLQRCPPYSLADRETPRQWIDKFFQEVASCYSDDFDKAYLFADFMSKGDDTFHLEDIVRQCIRDAHANNSKPPSMARLGSIFYADMWSAKAQRDRLEEFQRSYFNPNEVSMQKYVKDWLDVLHDIAVPGRGSPIEIVIKKLPVAFSKYVKDTRGTNPRTKCELGRLIHEFYEYLDTRQYKWENVLTKEEMDRCRGVVVNDH